MCSGFCDHLLGLVDRTDFCRDLHGYGILGIPQGCKLMLQDFGGDGKMSQDSCGDGTKSCNILYLTFMVHLWRQKFVFKLLKDVCSDFADTYCIIIS